MSAEAEAAQAEAQAAQVELEYRREEKRENFRYLRNLGVSLLEGSRTSDLREFSKFRDFSENRSVLFPSALATIPYA